VKIISVLFSFKFLPLIILKQKFNEITNAYFIYMYIYIFLKYNSIFHEAINFIYERVSIKLLQYNAYFFSHIYLLLSYF